MHNAFQVTQDFSKGLPSMFQRKANDTKTFFKSPAKKLRRFIRSHTYTIWFDKYCSSCFLCFLCLYRCFNAYSHLSLVKRLCKVVLETPLTLPTSFNNPLLWQQGYKNTSIREPPWRPVCCLFLFWCNIKSSFNDRCCWQCGSKRTTNHSKSMFVQVQIKNKTDE